VNTRSRRTALVLAVVACVGSPVGVALGAGNAPPPGFTSYRVQSGDTLNGIVARLHVAGGAPTLLRANPQTLGHGPDRLASGAVLRVPNGSSPGYVIQPGDTMTGIAARLPGDGGAAALYAANRAVIGPDLNRLRVGTTLHLQAAQRSPGHAAAPPTARHSAAASPGSASSQVAPPAARPDRHALVADAQQPQRGSGSHPLVLIAILAGLGLALLLVAALALLGHLRLPGRRPSRRPAPDVLAIAQASSAFAPATSRRNRTRPAIESPPEEEADDSGAVTVRPGPAR
jgi:hypothetical protein